MKRHVLPWSLIIAIGWYIVWPYLPEQIPRHYNAAGIVDGYFSKVEASSFSIGSMLVLYMMWLAIGYVDITKGSKQQAKVLTAINYAILFIGFGCNIFALLAASNYIASASIAFNFGLGTLFLVLGNYMQQTKPNGSSRHSNGLDIRKSCGLEKNTSICFEGICNRGTLYICWCVTSRSIQYFYGNWNNISMHLHINDKVICYL